MRLAIPFGRHVASIHNAAEQGQSPIHAASVDIYFSPNGGATEACIAAIPAAGKIVTVIRGQIEQDSKHRSTIRLNPYDH